MKKLIIAMLFGLCSTILTAQDYMDAIRYTQRTNIGDARYTAMSGAFAALGNNQSAILDNPASAGVFNGHSYEFSLINGINSLETNYNDKEQTNNKGLFNANVGLLLRLELPENELNAQNLNFSYVCNRVNDFNSTVGFKYFNTQSSMTDEFLGRMDNYQAYGNAVTDDALYTSLIYQVNKNRYVSDFVKYDNNGKPVFGPYGIDQNESVNFKGRINDNSWTMGTNFNNRVYLGASFNVTNLSYTEKEVFTESDSKNINPTFDSFTMYRSYADEGNGYGYKIGLIGLATNSIRLAAAYHSPVYWNITRQWQTDMDFYYTQNDTARSSLTYNSINEFKYNLYTPGKAVLGAAYIYKKTLIISADYEFQRYSKALFSDPDGISYDSENELISQQARVVNNFKVGTELKIKSLSLRAGTAFYQSPYSYYNDKYGDYRYTISGGVGLKSETFYIDLGVINSHTPMFKYIYSDHNGNSQYAKSKAVTTNVVLTLGLKY